MLTTRCMKEKEMKKIGSWISKIIFDFKNEKLKKEIKEEVEILCSQFPIDLD